MKRLVNNIGILVALLCIYACVDEPFTEQKGSRSLRFSIITTEEGIVHTRTANSNGVNNVFVLVFKATTSADEDPLLEDWAQASGAGTSTYTATLNQATTSGPMYVLANAPIVESLKNGEGLVLTKGMKLSEIKQQMVVSLHMNSGLIVQQPEYAPMVSKEAQYAPESTTNTIVELTRATTKVIVINASGNNDYALIGANMGNAPTKGWVFEEQTPQSVLVGNYGAIMSNKASLENMMSEVTAVDATKTEPLYLFEVAKEKEPFVIIKGTYNGQVGYHRLNIWNRMTEEYVDMVRNNQYIITINKLTTSGYRTPEEAIENQASNRDIDYDIEVTDPSAHDIVTNGEQYLGLSNSELVLYQSGALSGVLATKATYTCHANWEEGTVTATGSGLSITEGNKLINSSTVNTQEVKLSFAEDFTSGTLTFRLGDLSKVVKVTRRPTLSATPEEIVFDHATLGDKSQSGEMKSNIHFTGNSGMYSDDKEIFVSPGSKLYTLVGANVGYSNSAQERNGEFFVASTQDKGRTKVMFKQEVLDVFEAGRMQIQPYTYVATYHRAYQTAERIIRIKMIESNPDRTWTAVVLVGQHFIELDTEDSNDTGISSDLPYGYDESTLSKDAPLYTTEEAIEANCQFKPEQKGKVLVTGSGDKIFFRVGMKSKLAEEVDALTTQPRYGLIAFLYEGKSHLIYVRQGECEDYIMRPVDLIKDHTTLKNRPTANKVLPYNLTVPDAESNPLSKNVGPAGGKLTEYPSQGGYFFQGLRTVAYFPFKKNGGDIGWVNNPPMSDGDPCPAGYRRPNDGAPYNSGLVVGSELRQSFWLHPQDGKQKSNFDNFIRGYIADGYYDRRPMRMAVDGNEDGEEVTKGMDVDGTLYKVPTLVENGAVTGYAGELIYNPTTYASIFLPANGFRFSQISPYGVLRAVGDKTNLWSSTANNMGQQWYLAIGTYDDVYVFDNYASVATQGNSIRCVKN